MKFRKWNDKFLMDWRGFTEAKIRSIRYKEAVRLVLEEKREDFIIHASLVLHKKTNGKVLKAIYLMTKYKLIKDSVLLHPNCPDEIKVAEEL